MYTKGCLLQADTPRRPLVCLLGPAVPSLDLGCQAAYLMCMAEQHSQPGFACTDCLSTCLVLYKTVAVLHFLTCGMQQAWWSVRCRWSWCQASCGSATARIPSLYLVCEIHHNDYEWYYHYCQKYYQSGIGCTGTCMQSALLRSVTLATKKRGDPGFQHIWTDPKMKRCRWISQ